MLNQIIVVGRIANGVEVKEENGKKIASMTIAVPRSFKNADGEYETDFIDVRLFDSVATNTAEYCKKGDIVGIKGRLQSKDVEKYHEKFKVLEVIAEKVTFLSIKPKDEE